MGKHRLSKPALLLELRKILARPSTQVRQRKLKTEHAHAIWDFNHDTGIADNVRIVVDGRIVGLVQLVIHELLHVYFEEHFAFARKLSYEVEEAMVVGLAKTLAQYLESPARARALESWTNAIKRKLL